MRLYEQPFRCTPPAHAVRIGIGLACLLAVGAILAGCSGGEDVRSSPQPSILGTAPASANVNPTDVCALVTREEVSDALGANVTDRAAAVPPVKQEVSAGLTADISACQYSVAETGGFVKLDLWEAKGNPDKIREVTEFICSDREAISGLGDFACWYSEGHREIRFAKGGAYVDIKSGTLANDALRSLAEKAVARLP